MQPNHLYESPAFRSVTGLTIRPGGFTLTQKALSICDFPAGAPLLDVGCGLGATVSYLRRRHGFQAVGVDASAELIREGRENNNDADLILGQAELLPFPDREFAGVFCECVLSIVPDPEVVLSEILRVLKPGGRLVLTDLYARNPKLAPGLNGRSDSNCLEGARSRDVVLKTITSAGFQVLIWEDHSDLLKQLAAQMAWVYGSLDRFYSMVGAESCDGMVCNDVRRARPGYFLVVAQKEAVV